MIIDAIVMRVNDLLAGEELSYDMLKVHLDATIDDINAKLNAKFPVFSEFNQTNHPLQYPNYNFFPDQYIRKVVCVGAAHKFFVTDEEGASATPEYSKEYMKNLFEMERDYMMLVPEEYSEDARGFYTDANSYSDIDMSNLW